jgi:D-serine deaminase-like pyridoxal phosphate-dependent protein
LYGVPLPPSQVERIANISRIIGRRGGNVRLLVEHVWQLELVEQIFQLSGYPVFIYINIDIGGHHSGVPADSAQFRELFSHVEQIVLRQGPPSLAFPGFYCHLDYPEQWYDDLTSVMTFQTQLSTLLNNVPVQIIRYSVNATPIILYLEELQEAEVEDRLGEAVSEIKNTLTALSEAINPIEIHAGDYTLLDLNGLARNLRVDLDGQPSLAWNDIPLTILTEVSCLYPRRGDDGKDEALVSVGYSSLGSRGGRAHVSRGFVINWNILPKLDFPVGLHEGWQVDRVDAESGILSWKGVRELEQLLRVGQRLRLYPNDAASASEGFGWYFIIDSSRVGREDEVVDIFVRWRG